MTNNHRIDRRRFLVGAVQAASLLLLAGCDNLSRSEWFPRLLGSAEGMTRRVQRLITPRKAKAKEYTEADLSPVFPSNGNSDPDNPDYQAMVQNGFADWKLEIGGLVQHPSALSLAELRALPARVQITRHDCVEGWSAIGKWKGVPLGALLAMAQPLPSARYVVFHCADPDDNGNDYYESLDFEDAFHPQTILAYEMNDRTLPIANGAPIRLRVERQLGYKHAKYVMRIELIESFESIAGGKGGYWEDRGYEWYAGI
jgi:DMSO/TMAO reductase YedYZ molybdopterin-dependent catalytic subunit